MTIEVIILSPVAECSLWSLAEVFQYYSSVFLIPEHNRTLEEYCSWLMLSEQRKRWLLRESNYDSTDPSTHLQTFTGSDTVTYCACTVLIKLYITWIALHLVMLCIRTALLLLKYCKYWFSKNKYMIARLIDWESFLQSAIQKMFHVTSSMLCHWKQGFAVHRGLALQRNTE